MPLELTITMDDQGKLNISGPIHNKTLTYGLLELAKDAVKDFHAAQQQRVEPAGLEDLGKLTGKGN